MRRLASSVASYLMAGATDDGGEDGSGRVVTGKSGLAHPGAIVDHEGSDVVVTHLGGRAGPAGSQDKIQSRDAKQHQHSSP